MQPLQRAESVGPQIDGLFVAQDVRVPGLADHLARRGAEGFLAGHVEPQPVERGHHRRAGRIGAEANLLDQHRPEAPHRLVLVRQLDRVDVAMRTDRGDHPRQGLGQRLPGDLAEPTARTWLSGTSGSITVWHTWASTQVDRSCAFSVRSRWVCPALAAPVNRAPAAAHRARPARRPGLMPMQWTKATRIARRRGFDNFRIALIWAGRTGKPGQRRHPTGGNARGRRYVDTQGPDLAESKQGLDQRRTADLDRAGAQAVECGVALTWGHPQQAFELGLLCQADMAREAAPQPQLHPAAQPCHMPLQDAAARQQHLVRHQPGRGPLEQHAGPVGAGPAQCVQPPRQAPSHQGFGDLDIAVLRAYFGRVLPATLAGSVSIKSIDRRDMKLPSQRLHNGCRHLQRVGQERAQVADSAELDGEAQPVMVPSLARNPLQIDIAKVKVAVSRSSADGAPV